MGFEKSRWNLLLLVILLILQVVESRKITEEQKRSVVSDHGANKNDSSEMIFFTEKDLKVGNKIPIYFAKKIPSKSPHFLPRAEAESIPFSSKDLPRILGLFGFDPDSPRAVAVEYTLGACEAEPIPGETKLCATSFESMLDFARAAFGPGRRFTAARTRLSARPGPDLRNYTVMGDPREVWAPKMVACHVMPYPYAVYYCHHQESESRVYEVSLGGGAGDGDDDVVEAVAVCHVDTSHWSRDHASFRVLGIEPGASPVCHFFPVDNLVWIPERDHEKTLVIS